MSNKPGFLKKGTSSAFVAALDVVDNVDKRLLPADHDALQQQVANLEAELARIKLEARTAATQTSETWHDNFGFEDATKQMRGIKNRLDDLRLLLSSATIVEPDDDKTVVNIGRTVTIWDDTNGYEDTFQIGGYMVMGKRDDVISYTAPIAQIIMGAKVGDVVSGPVNGSNRTIRVDSID
jgi:transcription elongation GreA/GreB family factor